MYLMADVSRWLDHHGLEPAELNSVRIEAFLTDRCARGQVRWTTARALVPLFGYLRGRGIVPEPTDPAPASAVGELLLEFVGYLTNERGLAAGSIAAYRHLAELFLAVCAPDPTVRGCGLKRLEAQHINTFILTECARRSIGSTKNLVNTLRVLMRFLHLEGYTTTSLVESVPRAIPWRDSGRSRALEPEQVSRLLASCDRRTAAGRRDFAILTVLARLGLRRGEAASLSLDDVDWRAGEIVVSGKGGRRDRLPLPVDVGKALADYCRWGRSRNDHRALFLQVQAPHLSLAPHAVTEVVKRACQRAGLPSVGAHRLRHSTATAMRRAGAPLFEIGQILRHRVVASTALYAKDDLDALASIARPWSGAQS